MKRTDLEYLKLLSRLYLSEEETNTMNTHLDSILQFVERIHEVDLPEETADSAQANPALDQAQRQDLPSKEGPLSREELGRFTSHFDAASGHFIVPAVMD